MRGPTSQERGCWAVAEGDRRHGGNDGYDDEPDGYYTWDSAVPSHDQIDVGDRIVLWDKCAAIGLWVVKDIETWEAPKLRHRCPRCGQSHLAQPGGAGADRRGRPVRQSLAAASGRGWGTRTPPGASVGRRDPRRAVISEFSAGGAEALQHLKFSEHCRGANQGLLSHPAVTLMRWEGGT